VGCLPKGTPMGRGISKAPRPPSSIDHLRGAYGSANCGRFPRPGRRHHHFGRLGHHRCGCVHAVARRRAWGGGGGARAPARAERLGMSIHAGESVAGSRRSRAAAVPRGGTSRRLGCSWSSCSSHCSAPASTLMVKSGSPASNGFPRPTWTRVHGCFVQMGRPRPQNEDLLACTHPGTNASLRPHGSPTHGQGHRDSLNLRCRTLSFPSLMPVVRRFRGLRLRNASLAFDEMQGRASRSSLRGIASRDRRSRVARAARCDPRPWRCRAAFARRGEDRAGREGRSDRRTGARTSACRPR
jgi:hypothetical protein